MKFLTMTAAALLASASFASDIKVEAGTAVSAKTHSDDAVIGIQVGAQHAFPVSETTNVIAGVTAFSTPAGTSGAISATAHVLGQFTPVTSENVAVLPVKVAIGVGAKIDRADDTSDVSISPSIISDVQYRLNEEFGINVRSGFAFPADSLGKVLDAEVTTSIAATYNVDVA
ncbi:hypothetical protein [Candidatus Synchoanobacter obligatus]|uniref:Outer membrane protein beta-barrel domain-containing protein n=1 Tax=Candidatus Synchoanobacter obligatus TaxID=2919597 RepID=A0ABT1L5K1_9GAMM|nr:hypothetical protein [Candidatus Synchoanobacter obligatus]MCP8352005.1 hypothetical protein [Candidatus Synchoanobacter obligatus]